MSMRRAQSLPNILDSNSSPSFSNQSDQSFIPKPENLHQLHDSRISADRLFKILDTSMVAQKMGMKLAMDAINPTTGSDSEWKFISCFLDSTALLLDACKNIQLRLESIRNCLDSIPIGLHYLESEHEPSKVMLQQAAIAVESSRFRDKQHYSKMEKSMSRVKTFDEKLSRHVVACQDANNALSPELYKALSSSWTKAVFTIRVISSATCIRSFTSPGAQPLKVEPRTILLNEPSNKMKVLQKRADKNVSMEELESIDLASQTLLKLISAWQKGGSSSLRRMAVKAVAGELRRRKELLEKTLPMLENKIEEFYQQIVAFRISMLDLLAKALKEEELEIVKQSSYEESQKDINHTHYQRAVAWANVKKVAAPSCSLGRMRPPRCIGFTKNTSVKPYSLEM